MSAVRQQQRPETSSKQLNKNAIKNRRLIKSSANLGRKRNQNVVKTADAVVDEQMIFAKADEEKGRKIEQEPAQQIVQIGIRNAKKLQQKSAIVNQEIYVKEEDHRQSFDLIQCMTPNKQLFEPTIRGGGKSVNKSVEFIKNYATGGTRPSTTQKQEGFHHIEVSSLEREAAAQRGGHSNSSSIINQLYQQREMQDSRGKKNKIKTAQDSEQHRSESSLQMTSSYANVTGIASKGKVHATPQSKPELTKVQRNSTAAGLKRKTSVTKQMAGKQRDD